MRTMSVDSFHEFFATRTGAPLDGAWIGACKSTKIYCRPVCGVHPPRKENVAVFPSCAAAEDAGFRPCLLCCPEEAPFPGAVGDIDNKAVALIEEIRKHIGSPTCLENALAELALERKEASALCRTEFGADIEQLVATERRLAAKRLLRVNQCSDENVIQFLDDVASRCGFESGEALADEFKLLYKLDAKKLALSRSKRPRISKATRITQEN